MGLAAGDALGAAVEFMSLADIKNKYGGDGIQDFDAWNGFEVGSYTDDTQMALATAMGCIKAAECWKKEGIFDPIPHVYNEYLSWLGTQNDPFQRRSPGNTCLSALGSGQMGTMDAPINNSKGCGGVMRVAPVGLVFLGEMAFLEGAKTAAITHGHASGYLSAGFLAELVSHIVNGKRLQEAIRLSKETLKTFTDHQETLMSVNLAENLAKKAVPVLEAIQQIGEGWVGEEALAIAIYCSLEFSDDFRSAVTASVNHSGDSDSTGAITGAVMGALLGDNAIPERWISRLENSQKISEIADEIYRIFKEQPSDF
ncbi:MAG: ADP-ribosylglycohydrolase family protein [Candidatus Aminicenantales bacterium]